MLSRLFEESCRDDGSRGASQYFFGALRTPRTALRVTTRQSHATSRKAVQQWAAVGKRVVLDYGVPDDALTILR